MEGATNRGTSNHPGRCYRGNGRYSSVSVGEAEAGDGRTDQRSSTACEQLHGERAGSTSVQGQCDETSRKGVPSMGTPVVARACGDMREDRSRAEKSDGGDNVRLRKIRKPGAPGRFVRIRSRDLGAERSVSRHVPDGIERTRSVRSWFDTAGASEGGISLFRSVRVRLVAVELQTLELTA